MKKIFDLFITFFKIGLFTFGGGYAMISVIENECVTKKNWITSDDMKELIVLSESTPGPIAINSSTFIGYRVNKAIGSAIATLAVVLPSFIIITLISIFLMFFNSNIFVDIIFQGIRASVILLMTFAFLNLFKTTQHNILFYSLLILSFILNYILNVKSIYIILFGIIFSVLYLIFTNKKEKGGNINA